jgi:hypothetical protein
MDKSHIMVCEIFLPSTWFDVYRVHKSIEKNDSVKEGSGKYISIGVNVAMMSRILKVMSNRTLLGGESGTTKIRKKDGKREEKHVLKMGYEYNGDVLDMDIAIYGIDMGGSGAGAASTSKTIPKGDGDGEGAVESIIQKYGFELPLVFLPDALMDIPTEVEYAAEIRLSSEWMAELVKTLKCFGDNMEIQCSEEEVALSVNGAEQGSMRVPIVTDKLAFFSIEEGAELDMFVKMKTVYFASLFHKLSKQLVVRMDKERPLQWMYSLEGLSNTTSGTGGGKLEGEGVVENINENEEKKEDEEDNGFFPEPEARLVFHLVLLEE